MTARITNKIETIDESNTNGENNNHRSQCKMIMNRTIPAESVSLLMDELLTVLAETQTAAIQHANVAKSH